MSSQHNDMANALRFLAVDAVQQANSGHPGMPMGMADVATVLFNRFMKFDPKSPKWADRDRFVLSAGHGSMLLYGLLHLTGYEDMTMDEIKQFRQMGAKTAGHPEYGHATGIETTTGPLGAGLSTAVGMALAEQMMAARFGGDVVDHYTYTVVGDGCLMEGISHEAISVAGHMKLGKLIAMWDDNSICIDGDTALTVSDDQLARFKASGWDVAQVDGHDPQAVEKALEAARKTDTPSLIACKTVIGYGSPNKAGTHDVHGAPLGADEIVAAREKLGWPHPPFDIPADVVSAWREAGSKGAAEREAWEKRLDALPSEKKAEFQRTEKGELPAAFKTAMADYKKQLAADKPKMATRQASKKTLDVLAGVLPELAGGSADLTGSNLTKADGMTSVQPGSFGGNYIHYGVREHVMGAMMNGIALHGGFIPYGGTFFVFADYCRPSIRLSALMEQRVVYVMTHDSIGLGEDGPTHQPVEHMPSYRAIPNLLVFRPADAMETAECWELSLENKKGPSMLALTRQGLPAVRTEYNGENLSAKGAYVLKDASGERKATIMATGSEVEIALAAQEQLEGEGISTAVVSMPCWELFNQQPQTYQDSVVGVGSVRVGVEAALSMGWDRYIGENGAFVGMHSFGASAPAGELYKHFGITADAVVQAVKSRL